MHYFEESYRYYPSNFDNLIVLGFLYFREEIFEKAIKFFELACKVQPNACIAEIQYGKCYQKLGNNKEAYKVFRRVHNKFPEHKEALNYLIAVCKDLNLPFDIYYQKLNKLRGDVMLSDNYGGGYGGMGDVDYGQPVYQNERQYGMPADPSYKGQEVNYSLFSKHNQPTPPTNQKQSFMKYQQNADEYLP